MTIYFQRIEDVSLFTVISTGVERSLVGILFFESTLTHLSKKNHSVQVVLLSKSLTKTISLDLLKANQQFGKFEWIRFERSHDRFLIIDGKKIYHLGASLKDLGKKWFAFSELNSKTMCEILDSINQVIKNSNKEK